MKVYLLHNLRIRALYNVLAEGVFLTKEAAIKAATKDAREIYQNDEIVTRETLDIYQEFRVRRCYLTRDEMWDEEYESYQIEEKEIEE